MANYKNPFPKPWNKIDSLLVMAAMAETKEKRLREYARITRRFDVSRNTLVARLKFLGVRKVCAYMGPKAINHWRKQMQLLAMTLEHPHALFCAIGKKADGCIKELDKRTNRTVSIKEAARLLHVNRDWLRANVLDTQLLQRDEHGKISLEELRRFYEAEGRSLFARLRMTRKELAK